MILGMIDSLGGGYVSAVWALSPLHRLTLVINFQAVKK
jgi:hypothetical protein